MKRILLAVVLLVVLSFIPNRAEMFAGENSSKRDAADCLTGLSDPDATKETINLFRYLKNIGKTNIIFGQHHASFELQNSQNELISSNFKSDVKTAVGDHPGVFGFDFGRGITKFKNHVEEIYKKGGIITYSWHCPNPVTGSRGKEGDPVTKILPGGEMHQEWLKKLDEIADYFNSLEVNGVKVPIIFRPFHENTGGWFWWGATNCTPKQYVELWRMTADYLRKEKKVNNILMAYSPSKPSEDIDLTKAMYPGDEYVDIIGLDIYGPNEGLKNLLVDGARFITTWSKERNKIPAITEIGIKKGIQNSTNSDWFMGEFLNLIKDDSSIEMSFMLTWKNTNPQSYWVPLKGQPTYSSFVNFYRDPYTLFLSDILNVYGTEK